MMTKKVNIRIGNIELRKYICWDDPKMDEDLANKYEFVKWCNDNNNIEYCYVIAFANPTRDGYDIRTVGSRPWELDEQDFKDYNDLVGIFFHLNLLR